MDWDESYLQLEYDNPYCGYSDSVNIRPIWIAIGSDIIGAFNYYGIQLEYGNAEDGPYAGLGEIVPTTYDMTSITPRAGLDNYNGFDITPEGMKDFSAERFVVKIDSTGLTFTEVKNNTNYTVFVDKSQLAGIRYVLSLSKVEVAILNGMPSEYPVKVKTKKK